MSYLDPVFLIGMGVSFILGAFSYIIIKFWIGPISKYKKIKNQVNENLQNYIQNTDSETMEKIKQNAKKFSVNLSDSYTLDLPLWYRMVLDNRKESPVDASKHLMKLPNTVNSDHFMESIKKIQQTLIL